MSIRRRSKRSYQVRVTPFPAKSFPTREAAERYELELLLRRSQGNRFLEPSRTLGEEIDAWLKRWKATRKHSPRTAEFNEQNSKVWRRFGHVQVSLLRRAEVEYLVADRAAMYPKSAANELEFLKRVLRDSRARASASTTRSSALSPCGTRRAAVAR